jgi:filamentous hemagglutinin family protein
VAFLAYLTPKQPARASQTPNLFANNLTSKKFLLSQTIPDATLGEENSVVTPDAEVKGLPAELISGGAQRGENLFHSFREFNVGGGQQVYFANPTGIENILTRVTGENLSNISGTLGVNGAANLFLLNPNGIVFGANARLDVAGSFLASTAQSALFEDGVEFSAKNPQAPPLLAVKMPIGLQLGNNSAPIQVNDASLEVQPNRNLALIGGNVEIDRSTLTAPGGRINLGGLSAAGTVNLQENGNFSFPNGIARSDMSLAEGSIVDVSSAIGGNIAVNARNLNLTDRSVLNAGIAEELGEINARSGDIEISATDNISLSQSSGIQNLVNENASGNAGEVKIQANSLSISETGQINTSTSGKGDAGNIEIDTNNEITLTGTGSLDPNLNQEPFPSIVSRAFEKAEGNAGNIKLKGGAVSITNFTAIYSSNFSLLEGTKAGDVSIDASDSVRISEGSQIDTITSGNGDAGNINIRANSFSISDRGQIVTLTLGKGNAGNVDIQTDGAIELTGTGRANPDDNSPPPSIVSIAFPEAEGNAGNIKLKGGTVYITDFTGVYSSNSSLLEGAKAGDISLDASDSVLISESGIAAVRPEIGKAGNISINAKTLETNRASFLNSSNFGEGDSGSISLQARSISLQDPFIRSEIAGIGKAGDLNIMAEDSLTVTGGNSVLPTVTIETFGSSPGGNINLQAQSITLDRGIVLNARANGEGDGGNINVKTDTLTATRGGQFNANTTGAGNAGNININAKDSIFLDGSISFPGNSVIDRRSGLLTNTQNNATGNAGNLRIETEKLTLSNGAAIEANTSGDGNSGNVNLKVEDLFLLRNNSNVSTTAGTELAGGNGGNIAIDAGFLVGLGNSDITANAFTGRGGLIQIAAQGILGLETRQQLTPFNDITAFSQQNPQLDGVVEIVTPDFDPSRGSVQLPNQPIEAKVVQACAPSDESAQSEFVVTGRGGLPNTSREILNADIGWEDWRGAEEKVSSSRQPNPSPVISAAQVHHSERKIVEAQSWKRSRQGSIILTAKPTTANINQSWQPNDRCQMLQPRN